MTTSTTAARTKLEGSLAKERPAKGLRRAWLDVGALPKLVASDGAQLSTVAVQHLLAAQARHKPMTAAPEVEPWLALLAPHTNGEFALALLEQWFASDQEAADRWALALAGLVGDDRVVERLLPAVPIWCDEARHKLAEYAAAAIALVASDRALMVLDTLRARYRSKFRNIGAAAGAAFESAAAARGLSPDELGDVVMPRLGFDSDGRRRFEGALGSSQIELTADWKFLWIAADGERTSKSAPKGTPDDVVSATKALAKELREAVKAQVLRLEQALVRQRRWTRERFTELFLEHPLGRVFATRLVSGVHDAHGRLVRTFRRYENGVLADAVGRVDELAEGDVSIGFVHPLELTAEALTAWREHMTRQRVEQPFAQLDRAVVRLEANARRRREVAVAEGREVASGTFRGRAERRGWLRGSVVDAGMVSSYWKEFPGCGIEAVLDVDGLYIGIDPQSSVKLGLARFVRAGTVARGGYVYDDPSGDDPRVLQFGDVPPVVYSETIGDLSVIVGEAAAD